MKSVIVVVVAAAVVTLSKIYRIELSEEMELSIIKGLYKGQQIEAVAAFP